ncbi:chromatin remodeling protein SHL-like [Daucus carota subsp. sativus]|uniref:chromatin remodeling protein SHL-like n=1 Tax=Daucus carota subsp. sativus TaxID=79200 RepID=UPI0030830303
MRRTRKDVQGVRDPKGKKRISSSHDSINSLAPSKLRKHNSPHYNDGDCVLMMAPNPDDPPYVAQIVESKAKKVTVRWYYRPQDTGLWKKDSHGDLWKKDCHGKKEFRFEYDVYKKKLIDVKDADWLCICGNPYNPDLYVYCQICKSRFHPSCTNTDAKSSCIIFCDNCKNSPSQEQAADKRFERYLKFPRMHKDIKKEKAIR